MEKKESLNVYAKLKRMREIVEMIPQNIVDLYRIRVIHNESDFVGLAIHTSDYGFVGFSAEMDIKVNVRPLYQDSEVIMVEITTHGAIFTFYDSNGHRSYHMTLLKQL